MGEGKVEVLVDVSMVNLARAERRLGGGEYDSAVFQASLAVENAANAMILKLGGNEARGHRAVSGLAAVLRRVKPELLREERFAELVNRGREVQREVVYTRYPLMVDGKWLTPMEYYTEEKARRVFEDARYIVNTIKMYLEGWEVIL